MTPGDFRRFDDQFKCILMEVENLKSNLNLAIIANTHIYPEMRALIASSLHQIESSVKAMEDGIKRERAVHRAKDPMSRGKMNKNKPKELLPHFTKNP